VAKKTRSPTRNAPPRKKKRAYSPGEWFMAILGVALVIMVIVIVVTSVFDL
jgi:hypothetical protein